MKGAAGDTLGHLPADIAREFQPVLATLDGRIECAAQLTGGPAENTIGVQLDLTALRALQQARRTARA